VGFGVNDSSGGGGGTKREGTWSVRQVLPQLLESGATGKQTCNGDSGGPGFMVLPGAATESVVGVVSFGDQSCLYGGYDGRVDVATTWIRTTMGQWEAPTCALDGACVPGCAPVDQDCACATDGQCTPACLDYTRDPDCPQDCAANGVCETEDCPAPDPDCLALGSACSSPISCRGRLCTADPQHPVTYCTQRCTTAADCAAPLECGAGACRYPQLPQRALGESCLRGAEVCVGGACNGPRDGITRCVTECLVTSDCNGAGVCEAGADSHRYCRPAGVDFFPLTVPLLGDVVSAPAAGCSAAGGALPLLALAVLRARRRRVATRLS
jgi:hypothetical protein